MQTEDTAQNGLAPAGSFCSPSRTSSALLFLQSLSHLKACVPFISPSLPSFFLPTLAPFLYFFFPFRDALLHPKLQAQYTAKDSFELLVLVTPATPLHPIPVEHWGYRYVPPSPVYVIWR